MKEIRIAKRIATALICAALALSCAALPIRATASGENLGDALTVGVPTDRCPVFYRDADTGEITGIGVDLMRTAVEKGRHFAGTGRKRDRPVRVGQAGKKRPDACVNFTLPSSDTPYPRQSCPA